MKNAAQGNILQMLITDKMSLDYNIAQYNNYAQKINDEDCCINWINDQIYQRGGYFTAFELYELARHKDKKNEYAEKSQKYHSSACYDAKNVSELLNIICPFNNKN